MSSRHSLRGLRFARTLDEAFRTPQYATAIEIPYPSAWRRFIHWIMRRTI